MTALQRAIDIAGGQAKLGATIGVTQGLISQWVNGAPIHQRHFLSISRATDGQVTPEELLADELARLETNDRSSRREQPVAP